MGLLEFYYGGVTYQTRKEPLHDINLYILFLANNLTTAKLVDCIWNNFIDPITTKKELCHILDRLCFTPKSATQPLVATYKEDGYRYMSLITEEALEKGYTPNIVCHYSK